LQHPSIPRSTSSPAAPRLVSVVIPFLNAAPFLGEAIESVFAQTYDAWELLLVDDGSDDGSTDLAWEYHRKHPRRVKYLQHPGRENRGACASRNLGSASARGNYIALLDADDVWLPQKLECQVAALDANPEAGMVCGTPMYWFSWRDPDISRPKPQDRIAQAVGRTNALNDGLQLFLTSYPLGPGGSAFPSDLLIRREVLERVGGFEESFLGAFQLFEDQAFLAKVYLNSSVYSANECWTLYRVHERSCSAVVQQSGQYEEVRRFYFEWLQGYLASEAVVDPRVQSAMNRALLPYRYPRVARLQRAVARSRAGVRKLLTALVGHTVPAQLRRSGRAWLEASKQSERDERFGELRRLSPVSRRFGFDRGRPVDRKYIESFLERHAKDIQGRVLEVGDAAYTHRFGGNQVLEQDILHVDAGNPAATIVGDLASAEHIPSDTFDCILLTQTLQYIYDVPAAVQTICRILKPGGVLLATFPGITHTGDPTWQSTWYWSFTNASARRLFAETFGEAQVSVEGFGNVLAATAFLYGLGDHELRAEELDHHDPAYEVIIAVRAVKGVGGT
jgi:glycosyltransferase involved in cell wall biosynthesis